jgi:hypothetical protein
MIKLCSNLKSYAVGALSKIWQHQEHFRHRFLPDIILHQLNTSDNVIQLLERLQEAAM